MSNLTHTIKLQQLASNPKNSAWVFASAGSGKTKVLTDRVLRLLLDDVAPHKILCLTFTKVAAAEMQHRINAELAQWVLLSDTELVKKLEQLSGHAPSSSDLKKARILFAKILDSDSKIKIQTIHSFCQNLVKIFPFEAGIRPNFEVIESAQEKLLLQKAQREVLKKATSDAALKNLVTKINARLHDETFFGLISDLLGKKEQLTILKENYFGINGVIEEIFKNFSVTKNQTEEEIFAEFLSQVKKPEVLKLAAALDQTGLITNKNIAAPIKIFLQDPTLKNFPNYQQAFFTQANTPRKINGKVLENLELAGICETQRKSVAEFLDRLNSLKICNSTALLLKFVDQILEIYAQLKAQNSFLDYNDLIIETNRLLANPNFSDWVKMKMDGLFDHILIDESQDTNHQQWNIIKALTEDFFSGLSAANKNRTIFIVGDEKQSIYSFQGAEPNISQEIFDYFAEKLRDHPVQFHKIDLNNSFRSLATILQVVDQTFAGEKEKSAITKVSEFQRHQPIRSGVGQFEIWPQVTFKKEEKLAKAPTKSHEDYEWKLNFTPEENYSEQEFLAEAIAQKIKKMVEGQHLLEGRARAVNYSDFMILLRNRTNGFDKILSKFLHKYSIPVGGPSKINFAENLVIQDLLAAAKFSLCTWDDLNLAALLKSPILGLSEEELLEICLAKNAQQSTVFAALEQLPKFSETVKKLHELLKKSQELNCFEFFYFLLNQENRRKIISRFGVESAEILDKFSLKVFDFCENFSPDLQKFLDFIAKLDPQISLAGAKNNQVLITTVHSAKGLQAPIVFLPDCCFNTNQLLSTKEKISWIQFDESGLKLPIWCAAKAEEDKLLEAARAEKKREAKEEYLRLLYVAMTRAENELYVGGAGNTSDEECWYELIKRSVGDGWIQELSVEARLQTPSRTEGESRTEERNYLPLDPRLPLDGVCNPVHTFIKTEKELNVGSGGRTWELNVETGLQTPSRTEGFNEAQPTVKVATVMSAAQIKGKLVHKILEIFGKNYVAEKSWLAQLAEKIIAREEFLDTEEKNKIRDEVTAFLASEHFEKLFSGTVKCEVEIAGNIGEQKILNRIDLLIEKENEVLIVDYKSDEVLPKAVPQHYVTQLKTYEKLVKNLHPNKKISCAILWVKFLKLEVV